MEPVDPIKLQIPDYLDVVKRPMDLGSEPPLMSLTVDFGRP